MEISKLELNRFKENLRELGDQQLITEAKELIRAKELLQKTNRQLSGEDDSESEIEQDEQLYKQIIAENNVVLHNQSLKLKEFQSELDFRGLKL